MNEGLVALKELRENGAVSFSRATISFTYLAFTKRADIIEKELKRLEEYDKTIPFLTKKLAQKLKKEKALEIIRDKRVNVDYFIYTCVKNDWSYEDYLDEISNSDNLALCGQYCFSNKQPILTQEEYDLLKEVLVC